MSTTMLLHSMDVPYIYHQLQVLKRNRFINQFTRSELAPRRGTPEDPFGHAIPDLLNQFGWAVAMASLFFGGI